MQQATNRRNAGERRSSTSSNPIRIRPRGGVARNFAIILTLGVAWSLSAGEPLLTLARTRSDTNSERRLTFRSVSDTASATNRNIFAAESLRAFPHSTTNSAPRAMPLVDAKPSMARTALERKTEPARDGIGSWGATRVEAGFGEIYADKPSHIYGHNGTRWEEPSCGYVKVHFRF